MLYFIFTQRRIVAKSALDVFSGVSLFVCLFVNTTTSERVNIGWWNLGVGALYKNLDRVWIWGHPSKCGVWLQRWENQRKLSSVSLFILSSYSTFPPKFSLASPSRKLHNYCVADLDSWSIPFPTIWSLHWRFLGHQTFVVTVTNTLQQQKLFYLYWYSVAASTWPYNIMASQPIHLQLCAVYSQQEIPACSTQTVSFY